MNSAELTPLIDQLSRAEKVRLLQILVTQLAADEGISLGDVPLTLSIPLAQARQSTDELFALLAPFAADDPQPTIQ